MKNLFKKAHKLTKEMVEKYEDVDYQVQFGLFVSYLIEEAKEMKIELIEKVKNINNFNENDQELVLIDGREGQWLAIIDGFDSKYKYQRHFIEEDELNSGAGFYVGLEAGFIYNWQEAGKDQKFGIIENEELFEISEMDVKNLLNKGLYK